jgi:hypothetical protein
MDWRLAHRKASVHKEERLHTAMLRAGFEAAIPVLEQFKTQMCI